MLVKQLKCLIWFVTGLLWINFHSHFILREQTDSRKKGKYTHLTCLLNIHVSKKTVNIYPLPLCHSWGGTRNHSYVKRVSSTILTALQFHLATVSVNMFRNCMKSLKLIMNHFKKYFLCIWVWSSSFICYASTVIQKHTSVSYSAILVETNHSHQ